MSGARSPRVVRLAVAEALPAALARRGEAGHVWLEPDGRIETDTRVELSANSVHALIGHGVVDRLNALGPELAPLGSGRDALLPPPCLDAASRLLYEADRFTYGREYELPVGRAGHAGDGAPLEYRLRIDNRELQRTLARLQFLVTSAGRLGRAVRLRL